jgi:hypothetical protein
MKSIHRIRANWTLYFAERDIVPKKVLSVFRPNLSKGDRGRMLSLFYGKPKFTSSDIEEWANIKKAIERTDERNNGKIFS